MAEQVEDSYMSEEEMSDSSSSDGSSEATIVPTPEDTEPTEETPPIQSSTNYPRKILPGNILRLRGKAARHEIQTFNRVFPRQRF